PSAGAPPPDTTLRGCRAPPAPSGPPAPFWTPPPGAEAQRRRGTSARGGRRSGDKLKSWSYFTEIGPRGGNKEKSWSNIEETLGPRAATAEQASDLVLFAARRPA